MSLKRVTLSLSSLRLRVVSKSHRRFALLQFSILISGKGMLENRRLSCLVPRRPHIERTGAHRRGTALGISPSNYLRRHRVVVAQVDCHACNDMPAIWPERRKRIDF